MCDYYKADTESFNLDQFFYYLFKNSDKYFTYKHEPWFKKIKSNSKPINLDTIAIKSYIQNKVAETHLKEDIVLSNKISNQIEECNKIVNANEYEYENINDETGCD